jgi:hypothetical protein
MKECYVKKLNYFCTPLQGKVINKVVTLLFLCKKLCYENDKIPAETVSDDAVDSDSYSLPYLL